MLIDSSPSVALKRAVDPFSTRSDAPRVQPISAPLAESDSSTTRRESSLLANLTAIEDSFEASAGTTEQLTKLSISANLLARRCCATGAACSHAEAAAALAKYEGAAITNLSYGRARYVT